MSADKNRTQATDVDVDRFIESVTPEARQLEARALDALFRSVTGFVPRMWGPSMVGYGRYAYRYASGRTGEYFATGFSPRGKAVSIYILPGYADYGSILDRLGRHKTGKSCLYLNRLSDIDHDVLGELVAAGLRDLRDLWPVTAE